MTGSCKNSVVHLSTLDNNDGLMRGVCSWNHKSEKSSSTRKRSSSIGKVAIMIKPVWKNGIAHAGNDNETVLTFAETIGQKNFASQK